MLFTGTIFWGYCQHNSTCHLVSLIAFFYFCHSPEPHILLFRRPLGTDPQSGRVDPELERAAREEYKNQFGLLRK